MKELTFEDCNELIEKLKSSPSMSVKEEKYYQALVIARRTLQSVDNTQQQYESLVIKNV